MRQEVEETGRDATLVEDAAWIRVMGTPILEALPSRGAPYEQVDPFILVHEGRFRLSPEMSTKDTKHPHRGFTTSGTCWKARSAPATTLDPAEPWSGRG